MKVISPGVVALRPFRIHVNALTQEMVDFWVTMGAEAQEITDEYWSRNNLKVIKNYRIRMGNGDWSHKFNNESGEYLLHMREQYAPEASLFILRWPENIINHDIKVPENETAL